MPEPHHTPRLDLRNRAVRLLETFFASNTERERKLVFRQAFDGLRKNPAGNVDFSGGNWVFAADAVDKLLAFGGVGRGRHCLSLLLETMSSIRGRQTDPDYYELPKLLDAQCALPTREEERRYLDRLIEDIKKLARLYSPLSGIARIRPAATGTDPWKDYAPFKALIRHQAGKDKTGEGERRDYDDVLTAFAKVRQATLLGAPGSGKSTTLRRLALNLAQRAVEEPQAPIPLLASLGKWGSEQSLSQFLEEQAPEIGWAVEALAKAGRLALLLDGLNEVPTGKRGGKATEVKKLCQKLEQLNAATAMVASCRREDYTGDLDLQLDTLTLEPLPPQRIHGALRQWYADRGRPIETADRLFWQLAGDPRLSGVLQKWLDAGGTEDAFWSVSDPRQEQRAYQRMSFEQLQLWRRHIPDPRSLIRLAANPFMLTMLFIVWDEEGHLPKNRGDLFKRFVTCLLGREGLAAEDAGTKEWRLTSDGDRLLAGLAELAWRMQRDRVVAGQAEAGSFGVLTVVSHAAVIEALSSDLGQLEMAAPARLAPQDLLKRALDGTLLEGAADVRFRHQLLQEYFTALALRSQLGKIAPEDLWPTGRWWERTGWEEAAVLLAGFHVDDCSPIIRWLAQAQPEVAAQCILQSGAAIKDEPALLRELQAAWLPRLANVEQEPAPEARAAVGRALGRLGLDNRRGVGLRPDGLPDIEWVEIAGGPFVYQKGGRRTIERFWMSRYPITNAQYQVFLDAKDGYEDDRWWKGLDDPSRIPVSGNWGESNHARERVSWHEAVAFCAWLGHKLNLDVSPPTEWQWERAARGSEGRVYPWGNDYLVGCANINEISSKTGPHDLARASAVGIYPQGASVEGVMDLAGNVWEWCRNEYKRPDRTQPGGTQSRVLRGGSWGSDRDFARADGRVGSNPDFRGSSIGFRVVVSSPPKR